MTYTVLYNITLSIVLEQFIATIHNDAIQKMLCHHLNDALFFSKFQIRWEHDHECPGWICSSQICPPDTMRPCSTQNVGSKDTKSKFSQSCASMWQSQCSMIPSVKITTLSYSCKAERFSKWTIPVTALGNLPMLTSLQIWNFWKCIIYWFWLQATADIVRSIPLTYWLHS